MTDTPPREPLQIDEIRINLIKPNDGMIGFAAFVINRQLYISGVAIHKKADGQGYRLTYPTRKSGNRVFEIYHPITRQASRAIENAIFSHLKDVTKALEDCNAGYDSAVPTDEQLSD